MTHAQPAATASFDRSTVNDWALDLSNVDKIYKPSFRRSSRVHALRSVDLRVPRGSIFGLLGPNGAGKSTLVKILMTVIRPTACRGTMLGHPVGHQPTLAKVGYLPEHHRFPDYLTAEQILDHFGALALVPRTERKQRIPALLETVGIAAWSKTKIKSFSKGMRQRLGIANALINNPDLVVLDEPTDGVDPVGRRDIRNILLDLKSQGKTVFLNSHLLSELEMVCDTVAIMVQGRVHASGTIDELTAYSRCYEIEVESPPSPSASEHPVGSSAPHPDLAAILHHIDTKIPHQILGGTIRIQTDEPAAIQPLIDIIRRHGLFIRSVRPKRASLEDLFMLAVTDPSTGELLTPGAAKDTPIKSAISSLNSSGGAA